MSLQLAERQGKRERWRGTVLDEIWNRVFREVFRFPSRKGLFNFYAEADARYDRDDAQRIRRQNLRSYLESFPAPPKVLAVGEAPGPRGCRFSGVPFTSESQLVSEEVPFRGRQSSKASRPYRERTATIFWRFMHPFHQRVFLWNAVPFHPHPVGKPLSVRALTKAEVEACLAFLEQLLDVLRPRVVIAVGRQAQRGLELLAVRAEYVPHPSRRPSQFGAEMKKLFGKIR